jgi:predicted transcriptional regulator
MPGKRLTQTKINLIRQMRGKGFTYREITRKVGVAKETVRRYIKSNIKATPASSVFDLEIERVQPKEMLSKLISMMDTNSLKNTLKQHNEIKKIIVAEINTRENRRYETKGWFA